MFYKEHITMSEQISKNDEHVKELVFGLSPEEYKRKFNIMRA